MGRRDGEVNLIEVGRGKVRELQQDRSGNHGAGKRTEQALEGQEQQADGVPEAPNGQQDPKPQLCAFSFFSIRFLRNNLHKVKFALLKYTLVSFEKHKQSCNYSPSQDPSYFHHIREFICAPLKSVPSHTLICFLSLWLCLLQNTI